MPLDWMTFVDNAFGFPMSVVRDRRPVCQTPECPRYGAPMVLVDVWQGYGTLEREAGQFIRRAWVCKECKYEEVP